jgi:hypothetical protein
MGSGSSAAVAELRRHIERFNAGVRTGDFTAMAAALHPDAEMRFAGVPVGPLLGRDAIAAAYGVQPPDDEVVLLGVTGDATSASGEYAWASDLGRRPAGCISVCLARDGSVDLLQVDYYTEGRDR